MVRNERVRVEGQHTRLLEERKALAAQFSSDKQSVLALHVELNAALRPLSAEWLQGGIELLMRLHETSDLAPRLAKYRKLL